MWALNASIRGAYWFISAIACRIGASKILSSPAITIAEERSCLIHESGPSGRDQHYVATPTREPQTARLRALRLQRNDCREIPVTGRERLSVDLAQMCSGASAVA